MKPEQQAAFDAMEKTLHQLVSLDARMDTIEVLAHQAIMEFSDQLSEVHGAARRLRKISMLFLNAIRGETLGTTPPQPPALLECPHCKAKFTA